MSEKTININVSDLKKMVKEQLSFVGKRQGDKQGNTMFAGVTLSSTEEAILNKAIHGAAETFASELSPKITSYNESGAEGTLTFSTYGLNDAKAGAVENIFTNYAIAYIGKVTLGKNYPELAKEFADETASYLESAIKLAYSIDAPSKSDKTLKDMNGAIYNDDGTPFRGVI